MRKGTKVWIKGHTKDLWIENYNCKVETWGVLLEDIKKDAKKVSVRLNTIAGQYNVKTEVRISKLKELNQETLKEIYVYGSQLIGGKVKNNILNKDIYKKDLDVKFQVQIGNYDINKAKQIDIEDEIPKLVNKLKKEKVKVNISQVGFTYVVKFAPTNENIWVILKIILTYMEKRYGIVQTYSDSTVFHVEYNGDFLDLFKRHSIV